MILRNVRDLLVDTMYRPRRLHTLCVLFTGNFLCIYNYTSLLVRNKRTEDGDKESSRTSWACRDLELKFEDERWLSAVG